MKGPSVWVKQDPKDVMQAELFRSMSDLIQEEGAPGLSAETFLAANAALVGELLNDVGDGRTPDEKEEIISGTLQSVAGLLEDYPSGAKQTAASLSAFEAFYQQSKARVLETGAVTLSVPAYHAPHLPPAECGALLAAEARYLAAKVNMSPEDLLTCGFAGLADAIKSVAGVIPPDIAYKLALEPAIGVSHTPPLDRAKASEIKKLYLTRRVIDAANELTQLLYKQHIGFEGGLLHPPSLAAEAGAYLGRATYLTVMGDCKADYISSGLADQFLEDANIMVMVSYMRRGGDIEELAEYGTYVDNAARSFGSYPYPPHHVAPSVQPHAGMPIKAALTEGFFAPSIQEYDLRGWEIPSTGLVAMNDCLRVVSMRIPVVNEKPIPMALATRLAMEEAAGLSRMRPYDLEKDPKSLEPSAREALKHMQEKAAKAIVNVPYPFE